MSGFRRGVRLGIDVGKARVGVARCDPDGMLAVPVETVQRADDSVARIVALADELRPHVGDTVSVEAQLLPDGTLRALRVVKVASAPAQLTIVGRVMRATSDRWIVGRWTVLISPRTTISGDIETGDRVRVIGERQADTKYVVAHSIYEE